MKWDFLKHDNLLKLNIYPYLLKNYFSDIRKINLVLIMHKDGEENKTSN